MIDKSNWWKNGSSRYIMINALFCIRMKEYLFNNLKN